MNEIEVIGDLAQAGLTARALEPTAGEAADSPTHEGACLNCGTPLVGSHCHACGQRGHQHKTLGAFFHDLLHGVLHFEGKIWRTVPMLVWQPGKLTREYIDGRRASYVSPIALFLFTMFLFFAVFNALGTTDKWAEGIQNSTTVDPARQVADLSGRIDRLQGRLVREADADDRAELNRRIAELNSRRDALKTLIEKRGPGLDIDARGQVSSSGEARSLWQRAKQNPKLLIYKFQTNAYKYSWLLIPLSLPFVALTFLWRRKFGLYDHLIFTTYSITFMFALVAAATLSGYFVSGWAAFALLLYAPFHMFRQLRGTYGLRWYSALWRLIALSVFAQVTMLIWAGFLTWLAEV
jgi:hypothetical protein